MVDCSGSATERASQPKSHWLAAWDVDSVLQFVLTALKSDWLMRMELLKLTAAAEASPQSRR